MRNNHALILMSTYQGEKYLAAQLDSMIAQTHKEWTLLIRDDGSTDQTLQIIQQYEQIDPRIHYVSDCLGNLKPSQSFSMLMNAALLRDEEYIFFADQDDIWIPEKIALFVEKLAYYHHSPSLVFSDLTVVNERLQPLHASYLAFEKLKANTESPIRTLLTHNFVTGCAMAINRPLLQIAAPIPQEAMMHDWWCALCASVSGNIIFIDQKTVLYRQHGKNDTGSHGFYSKCFPLHQNITRIQYYQLSFAKRFLQANHLLLRIDKQNPYYDYVKDYVELPQNTLIKRIKKWWKMHLQSSGIIRKAGFFLWLIAQR